MPITTITASAHIPEQFTTQQAIEQFDYFLRRWGVDTNGITNGQRQTALNNLFRRWLAQGAKEQRHAEEVASAGIQAEADADAIIINPGTGA